MQLPSFLLWSWCCLLPLTSDGATLVLYPKQLQSDTAEIAMGTTGDVKLYRTSAPAGLATNGEFRADSLALTNNAFTVSSGGSVTSTGLSVAGTNVLTQLASLQAAVDQLYVTTGLEAWYFHGTDYLIDHSGNGHDLTQTGNPGVLTADGVKWVTGGPWLYGPALPNCATNQALTISIWFKSPSDQKMQLLITSPWVNPKIEMTIDPVTSVMYRYVNAGPNSWTAFTNFAHVLNEWRHVVMIWADGDHRAYLDGTLVGSNTDAASSWGSPIGILGFIVGYIDGIAARHFAPDTEVRDYRFYSRALSADEVQTIYNLQGRTP